MLDYAQCQTKPARFLSLTSLKPQEFDFLLRHFAPRSERYFRHHTWRGTKRAYPRFEPQADEKLADPAQQLFFLLVYLKNNPLQEFQAALFDISQGSVSNMARRLVALLNETLTGLGLAPCQDTDSLRSQLDRLQPRALSIDATERNVPRSSDQTAQQEEYSGKAKAHTSKNQVLCDDVGYVHFLSLTYEGKIHDKALAEAEALSFPPGLLLRQDTGYQGYAPPGAVVSQPTKKPRKAELSGTQKLVNQSISTMRVVVEHAIGGIKRLHCLGHGLRLRGWSIRDELMRAGTGLHNLRVTSPLRGYGPHALTWAL
jgi:hypothetical protein